MRKILLYISFLSCGLAAFGQQAETYTQYLFNQYALNPAIAGTDDCINIKVGHRDQWTGTSEHPKTTFFTIHKALGNYKYGRLWHGVGAYMLKDETGPLSYFGLYPSYTVHLKLNQSITAAFGIFAGIREHAYRSDRSYNDPVLDQSKSVLIFPDLTPGFRLTSPKYFLGISVKQVYKNRLKTNKLEMLGSPSNLRPHLYVIWGKKRTPTKSPFSYYPSIMFKYAPVFPPTLDFNLLAFYREMVGVGASYRPGNTFSFLMKIKFLKMFSVGYSYDITLNRIATGTFNSHEIILGIKPCLAPDFHMDFIPCPSY